MNWNKKEVKFQEILNKNNLKEVNHKVVSVLTQLYEQIMGPCSIDHSEYIQNFHRSMINYAPYSPYQSFSYQVERVFPSLDFYKIKVNIAHFALTISAAKIPQRNILANYEEKQRNPVHIYFINLKKQKLCLKSFTFKSHSMFQQIFPNVIKQWTINRICSALQCGPYISNALGFDLLIFDDCIQYATEEGRKMNGFSQMDSKHLREQLAIMHSFKIMHIDIKPQNTIFSQHFRKPVFIDFGYSDIIEETVGFKSVVRFKGTPNFCSPQMLAIMLELEGYVDLYYNDAYGLKQLQSSDKILRPFLEFEYAEDQDNPSTSIFIVYAFQYYYLQSNLLKARQVLLLCLNNNEKYIKRILLFIKSALRSIFIREIFEEDLCKCQHLVEYREIKEELKINLGRFFYKGSLNQTKQIECEEGKFQPSSFILGNQIQQNFHHYLSIILNLCKLKGDNAMNFVSIAFQCVRFDVKNIEVFEKKQIAQKMNSLLLSLLQADKQQFEEAGNGQKQQEIQSLKQIKVMFRLIFQFCLSHPSKWVKEHIFDVCQQMILISIDFHQYLVRLDVLTNQIFTQSKEQALVMFQYLRLRDTIQLMEIQKIENVSALLNRLNQFIVNWLSKFKDSSAHSREREVVSIRNLLQLLQQKITNIKRYSFDFEEHNIKEIQNIQIRKYIVLFLTRQKIDHFIDMMSPQQVLRIVQFVKSSSDLRNLDFLSSSLITMTMLTGINNFAAVQAYYNYLCSVINCDTISKSLKVKQKVSLQSTNVDFLQNRVKSIKKAYQQSVKYDGIYCQLFSVFVAISQKKIVINDQLKDSIFEFYELHSRQSQNKKVQSMKSDIFTNEFLNAFYYIQFEYRFYCFSDRTKDLFLNNLAKSQEENSLMKELSQVQPSYKLKHIYCHFKTLFYQYHYYLHNQQLDICLQCLNLLGELLQCLRLNLILFEIIKLEIQLALSSRKMEIISSAIYKLYNVCCQINFKSFYLTPRNVYQTYITFVIFQSSNQPLFYSLLNELTIFHLSHPIECYFQFFLEALDRFIACNPSRGYALHYSKFVCQDGSKNLQSNPYLLIFYVYSLRNENAETQLKIYKTIVLNCDRLSTYAKKKMLERCFGVYFDYLTCKGQQQKLFNFRMIKHYISEKKRRNIYKVPKIINNTSNFNYLSLIQKLKCYKKYLF